MPITSRDKMISFRLSRKEYERLREFRVAQGARSISELARAAVTEFIGGSGTGSDSSLETRVKKLERQLRLLAFDLKQIKQAD